MAEKEGQRLREQRSKRRTKDLPCLIKYIVLLFLLLLLGAEFAGGEFTRLAGLAWLILIIKLILIFLLILLLWVQKALVCELTAPTGCTEEQVDAAQGILFVKVMGTASGAAFGHYTLEVKKGAITYPASIVSYPAGGGAVPVIGGELGTINTTSLSDATYTITLTVYPAGLGSPKSCTITFDLLKVIVYMNRVAGVQAIVLPDNANPFDPTAELRTDYAVAPPPHDFRTRSLGGSMTIKGAAYIYECAARKIKKYEIRHARVTAPGTEPPQPSKGAPIPATWPGANTVVLLEYTLADQYQPWTRVGPMATDLVNSWFKWKPGMTEYYKLSAGSWGSGAAGNGRFSLLLTAEDTTAVTYHDIQHIWLDNKPIIGKIVKFQRFNPQPAPGTWQDLPACVDLLVSFGTIRIMGLAWDPVIDEAWWPPVSPNDNFGHYRLDFWRQFEPFPPGPHALTSNIPNRVPALPVAAPVPVPTDADAAELAQWNLTTLDAGPIPSPYSPPPYPKIYRGEACTYILQLFVTDTTIVNEGTTHYVYHQVPVKIVNDL